jgi:iron complex outermembrane receptor protein
MQKLYVILLLSILLIPTMAGQNTIVQGTVKDSQTGEALIGATILYGEGKGTITNISGTFNISLPPGEYKITASYVGYNPMEKQVTVGSKTVFLNFGLQPKMLEEVQVVADQAISRETPVAFSNVPPAKLESELAGRDIPMILNTTPGVYATEQGGGDGDARITIRGFSQRNVAVMIDGIPMNDMENGWVYWSNWFGLDEITRNIQVQRGLGASKLALPSVGGTLNILTKGIESKREVSVKNEVDSEGKFRTSLAMSSGVTPGGWSLSLAGSYKRGNGWVDQTFSEGWFYFFRLDKRIGKHLITASGFGAPQHHEQRTYELPIASYDVEYAADHGVPVTATGEDGNLLYVPAINDMGRRYNQHWGVIKRDRFNPDAPTEILSERVNVYHKPQFSLRDFWNVSDNFSISNILYLSMGYGGGDSPHYSLKESQWISDPSDPYYGQIDWQSIYDENAKPTQTPFGVSYPINTLYSDSLYYATNYLTRKRNEHIWYGYLSTFQFRPSNTWTFSGGIDLRSYKGKHYETITDLLGADYAIDRSDLRVNYGLNPSAAMKFEGDTVNYNYLGLAHWGGVFGLAEYKKDKFSAFLNLTSALNGYKKVDYFNNDESAWKWTPGYTVKTGANYNLDNHSNIFANIGLLSKTRDFQYFFIGYTTDFRQRIENEIVKSAEIGYSYHSPRLSANLNSYLTFWHNKPTNTVRSEYQLKPGEDGYTGDPQNDLVQVYADIPGMDAIHKGVELDFVYKIRHNLEFQGLLSLGDWKWDKKIDSLQFYNRDTNKPVNKVISFDARGIHVGDAAQTQVGGSLQYEPIKGFYLNARYTYFDRYYSEFTPETTTDENGNVVDSWMIPHYGLLDFHTGYAWTFRGFDKARFQVRFSLLNVMDNYYITDAVNNDPYTTVATPPASFDAKAATVFFGMGRRFITSLKITF